MKREAANCGGLSSFAVPILRRQSFAARPQAENAIRFFILMSVSVMSRCRSSRTSAHGKPRDFCLIVHVALKQMNEAFGFV
jgi:hypothetical protein